MPKGGPDKYLEQKYDCQEILVFEPFQVATFMYDYRSQAQLGNMFSQNWFSSLTEFASLKLRHSWMELYFETVQEKLLEFARWIDTSFDWDSRLRSDFSS